MIPHLSRKRSGRPSAPRTAWPLTSVSARCSCWSTTSSRWSSRLPNWPRWSRAAQTSDSWSPSRALLRVRGEVEYPVSPLADPDAVELFCTRARMAPDGTIHELCRALDNLPLALELAAARAACSRRGRSWSGYQGGWTCSGADGMPTLASRRSGPPSNGRTSSSRRKTNACSHDSRFSPGDARWRLRKR